MHTAGYWIKKLNLQKHPEGGYFREIYRSGEEIKKGYLPKRYGGPRSYSTSIYFLLKGHEFSAFHRIKSDETWHFYEGSFVLLYIIDEAGKLITAELGTGLRKNGKFQVTIPHGSWFAASVEKPDSYALVGCTVSPGFDYDDFELADKDELVRLYPQHKEIIRRFTRG